MVDALLKKYNEPLLNMHFLSPYMKDSLAGIGSYDLIFDLLPFLPDDDYAEDPADKGMKTSTMMFLDSMTAKVRELKLAIVRNQDEKYLPADKHGELLNKILVYMHLLIQIVTRGQFIWHTKRLEQLATEVHELRLMPLPYGLLPHKLVEVIDNERIMPGLSQIYKIGDDCPLLNDYDADNMSVPERRDGKKSDNWQQICLLYEPQDRSPESGKKELPRGYEPLHSLIKRLETKREKLLEDAKDSSDRISSVYSQLDLHRLRFTFIYQTFEHYEALKEKDG